MAKKKVKKKRRPLKFDYLPIDKIDVSLLNVRKTNLEEGIEQLASSIESIGIQQPVVVIQKGDRYDLIIGQRRYLAFKRLERKKIPALITKIRSETDGIIKSFCENIHRLDLEYRNKMQVATLLMQKLGSIKEIAKQLGVTEQTVVKYLGYAAVPEEIKKMVDEGNLGATTALEIVRNITDSRRAIEIAEKIQELPRSEDRNYLIDVARESPDKSVKTVFKLSKRRSLMKEVTIHVTQKVYDAINKAAAKYERDTESVAREAIEDWLSIKGFIK